VKERFDKEGVSIPFPQRDIHIYNTGQQGASVAHQLTDTAPVEVTEPSHKLKISRVGSKKKNSNPNQ
jgi:small-conductance mechanosensitive channel